MEAKQRASLRSQVTKLCNSISENIKKLELVEQQNQDVSDMELTMNVLLERLKNAHVNLWQKDAMSALIEEDKMEDECEAVNEYDDKAVTVIASIEFILRTKFEQKSEKRETWKTKRFRK